MRTQWTLAALAVALAGCQERAPAQGARPEADPDVLIEADRAFDAAVASGGAEAWASFFAEDGAMVSEGRGEIRGRGEILEAVAFLNQEGVSLRWSPDRAEISSSGDLGYTVGRYASVRPGEDGIPVTARGVYVSIWRLQADGSWKVVMDLGNPTDDAGEGASDNP